MLDKKELDYFEYGKIENKKFWKRLGGKPDLKNKSILDFGCGHGALCIDLAQSGAKSITGIDLNSKLVDFAKNNLNLNYSDLKEKVFFGEIDLLKSQFNILAAASLFLLFGFNPIEVPIANIKF